MVFQSPAHVERVTPVGLYGSARSSQASGAAQPPPEAQCPVRETLMPVVAWLNGSVVSRPADSHGSGGEAGANSTTADRWTGKPAAYAAPRLAL